jgi:hypothetical protein
MIKPDEVPNLVNSNRLYVKVITTKGTAGFDGRLYGPFVRRVVNDICFEHRSVSGIPNVCRGQHFPGISTNQLFRNGVLY